MKTLNRTKLEYDYLGFGTNSFALGGVGATVNSVGQVIIKVGVNYHLLPDAWGWF
jgi:hypothetical protein